MPGVVHEAISSAFVASTPSPMGGMEDRVVSLGAVRFHRVEATIKEAI
jgi:hypothetical protein